MFETYFYVPNDAVLYCANCAPDDAEEHSVCEADSPQYCDECGEFLKNPLTPEGRKYVMRLINQVTYGTNLSIFSPDSTRIEEAADFYGIDPLESENFTIRMTNARGKGLTLLQIVGPYAAMFTALVLKTTRGCVWISFGTADSHCIVPTVPDLPRLIEEETGCIVDSSKWRK